MGYIQEAKEETRKRYGWYCNKCKQHGIKPISYTEYKEKLLTDLKNKAK